MPVTHFCASDGSRRFATEAEKKAGDDEPHVARVVVAHDGSELRTLGGRLDPRRQGFERHSYEAELAGFHDHLTSTEDTVTVIVTDCLSGAMAGGRWRSRTAADKANRYRAQELDTLSGLEQQHRAVVYLWVHSHVGITPNEAADAECDAMQLGDFSALDLAPTSFHLMRVRGLKRGVGRPVLEFFEARLMHSLDEASLHTLRPQQGTWPLLANVRKQRLMRETDIDVLEDARGNRVGLFGDRLHDSTPTFAASPAEAEARRASQPTKGSWEWFRQRCGCPCCQAQPAAASVHVCGVSSANGVVQSRWHMFTECSPDDEDIGVKRAEAAGWLARHVGGWGGFGTKQAEYALAALTGGARALDDAQRHAALRFFLGLPDKPLADKDLPPSEQKSEEQQLAGGYCRYFCKRMADILRAGVRARVRAEQGTMLQGRRREALPRSTWMGKRGLREMWSNREWTVKCFRALRLWPLRAHVDGHSLAEATRVCELRRACGALADALAGLHRSPQQAAARRILGRYPRVLRHLAPPPAAPAADAPAAATAVPTATPMLSRRADLALVHLRLAATSAIGVAEAKARRAAAEAAQRQARAARVAQRVALAQAAADAKAAAKASRFSAAVAAAAERGRQCFAGLMQKLYKAANADDTKRGTLRAIRKMSIVRDARARTGNAFGSMLRGMVDAAERDERRRGTARAIRRIERARHVSERRPWASRAFAQVVQSLAGVGEEARRRERARVRAEAEVARQARLARKRGLPAWDGAGEDEGVMTRSRRPRVAPPV